MSRNSPEGRLLTEYEGALDSFHQSLPLWGRPRPEARFALLAAFDLLNAVVPFGLMTSAPHPHAVQQTKWLHDSLIYAMQFLWRAERSTGVSVPVRPEVLEEALAFLMHCKDYAILTDFHVGLGRGLYTLDADPVRQLIRFVPKPAPGAAPDPLGILEEYHKGWDQMNRVVAEMDLGRQVVDTLRGVARHFEDGRVVLDDVSRLKSAVADRAVEVSTPGHDIPLGDDCDLAGFTAGEFRQVWRAVLKWSMAASGAYLDACQAGMPQDQHLPTQLVRRDVLVHRLAHLTDLPAATVEACVGRMSFGHLCPRKPDVFLQPFLCDEGWVAWSPFLVQVCNAERNQLKLMARVPALKATADNLIGSRERAVARQVGELLGRYGFQFKTRIGLPDGVGEIDVLAFHDKNPTELLVIEVKGVLEVDEVNEVDHATDELMGGQEQLRKAIGVLEVLPPADRARLWSKPTWPHITRFYGVVLAPTAQPNARYDHREYPAVTLDTLRTHFRSQHFRSPRRLWEAAVAKPWLRPFAVVTSQFEQLRVGGVTYEIPVGVRADPVAGPATARRTRGRPARSTRDHP